MYQERLKRQDKPRAGKACGGRKARRWPSWLGSWSHLPRAGLILFHGGVVPLVAWVFSKLPGNLADTLTLV